MLVFCPNRLSSRYMFHLLDSNSIRQGYWRHLWHNVGQVGRSKDFLTSSVQYVANDAFVKFCSPDLPSIQPHVSKAIARRGVIFAEYVMNEGETCETFQAPNGTSIRGLYCDSMKTLFTLLFTSAVRSLRELSNLLVEAIRVNIAPLGKKKNQRQEMDMRQF